MTQEQAMEILKSGKNAFITGPAGSGKTFVLNRYIDWLKASGANVAVTASTGIAATHLDGITIHSWTGMGVRGSLSKAEVKDLLKRGYLRRRFLRADVLVIDEISMLSRIQLDLADLIFREFKQVDAPFGGIQTVLCGDFFQLPPIARKNEPAGAKKAAQSSLNFAEEDAPSEFSYHARSWKALDLKICYLDEQYRQSDQEFLRALNAIRSNSAGESVVDYLQSRVDAKINLPVEPTKLYTHNVDVDVENNLELQKISGKEFRYKMELVGPAALAERLQKGCLAPPVLRLKAGARVMFVKNNFEEGYVNGTLGVVQELEEGRILVRTARGAIDVGPAAWHIAEEGKIKAEISQYPLRLAWAITIHKSQGMSLDAARVDLRQSFEPGMGYVALSRVRSSAGLSLAGFNKISLQVNAEVLEFDKDLKRRSEISARQIAAKILPPRRFSPAKPAKEKVDTVAATRELLNQKFSLAEIAEKRNLTAGTILAHCEKLKAKFPDFDFSGLAKNLPPEKIKQMKTALKKSQNENGAYPLTPAMELLGGTATFEELRLARLLI